ncbi:MAG: proton-conducting transporter membrane subunit [archaeon]
MNLETIIIHAPALVIFLPLLVAFATPLIDRVSKQARNAWILFGAFATEVVVLLMAHDVVTNGMRVYTMGASDPAQTMVGISTPVRIILSVDAMSAFMAVVSMSVVLAVCIYSIGFMKKKDGEMKYSILIMLMTAGMLGLELTGDLFTMFVFFELLSIASAALVGFWLDKKHPFEAAFKYMVVSALSALMLLFAIGLLYGQYDALNIAALAKMMKFTLIDKVALAILVTAFAVKCGAVPLHMWVSDAYGEAPAPITAALVVASQASLYALFRVCFSLFGSIPIHTLVAWALIIFGVLSMFIGVTMALPQKDVKRLMAYHAVSQTGYMLLGVGVGLAVIGNAGALLGYGITAVEGGLFHMVNHAMYKGLLFLTAGAMIYRLGTKNLNEMGGLAHKMPFTTIFFLIGAFAIAGVPPFNGFASKFMIYESVYQFNPMLAIIAMVVSILTLASFMKVFHSAFMGPAKNNVKEVPFSMLLGMGLLAAVVIIFGLFPDIALDNLVRPAAHALLDQAGYIAGVLG